MTTSVIPKELVDDLLPGEKAYQVCHVAVRWSMDIGDRDVSGDPAWMFDDLPDGRMWNSAGSSVMPKALSTFEEIAESKEREWWPVYQKKGGNPADLSFSVTFQRWETWCLSWFEHWTWDIGLSESEVLASFERFVMRTEEANRRESKLVNGYRTEPYCLMGAEDRYRWKGTTTGEPDEYTDPPCRCPHCKEQGVVRIGH